MNNTLTTSPAAPVGRISSKAWWVLVVLCLAGLLNYVDRQTLSVLKGTLKEVFALSDTDYSYLITAFMVPYILMYGVSGWLVDRLGTRVSLCLFVAVWSIATVLCGSAQSVLQLAAFRALLGLAEPGAFPASQRAMMRWFPPERRAFALSLLGPGTALGSIIAPPLIAWIATRHGWQSAFILPGVVGLGVALIWWWTDRGAPAEARPVAKPQEQKTQALPLRELLRRRELWAILAVRMISDPLWYFYLFWLPGYFQERLGLSLLEVGRLLWIPSLATAVAGLGIGHLSDALIRRGMPVVKSRLLLMKIAACITPLGMLTGFFPSVAPTLVIVTIVWMACSVYLLYTAVLVTDCLPAGSVGTGLGLMGACGATGAMVVNFIAGPIVEHFGYTVLFIAGGVLHPIAYAVIRRVMRDRPVTA